MQSSHRTQNKTKQKTKQNEKQTNKTKLAAYFREILGTTFKMLS